MADLSVFLLGPFQVLLDGKPLGGFATDKTRALLAYLATERAAGRAVEGGRAHSRSMLAGLLWPDQPEDKARQSLRQTWLYLRQAFGESADRWLKADRDSVQFDEQGSSKIDVVQFMALDEACRAHRHRRIDACLPCLRRLEQMADLYRGDLLVDVRVDDSDLYEEWIVLKREWFRRRAVEAFAALSVYQERRGHYAQARRYAQRQVELEPWHEEAHRALMRLLALDGQRSAALAQYQACRQLLSRELGIEPTEETTALAERIRVGQLEPIYPRGNLPSLTSDFVGRHEEQADLAERLADPHSRLVTLIGSGGIGKTRLAMQVAGEQVGLWADGVWWVSLAEVSSPDEVLLAIARTVGCSLLGRRPVLAQLSDYLREKEMLIVLDSVEQALSVVPMLGELVHSAPAIALLITSRERIDLKEAWHYEIEGLSWPPANEIVPERTYEAVELFVQRARYVNRRFDPVAEAAGIAQICRLVEGMPLAIELAAAWMRSRSCAEIVADLGRTLDVLSSSWSDVTERHRSVYAALEYSWRLLSEREREALCRLSVFGGFTGRAAAEVADVDGGLVSALIDRSLLRRGQSGRFEMHELLRQYMSYKLNECDELRMQAYARHARFYLRLLTVQEPRLKGAEQPAALAEIGAELDNLRAAWRWAIGQGYGEEIAAASGGLGLYYAIQSWYQEGLEVFEAAANGLAVHGASAEVLGRLWAWQGKFAYELGLNEQAMSLLERAVAVTAGHEQILTLNVLGALHTDGGDYAGAEQVLQKALALSRASGDLHDLALTLSNLSDMNALQGRFVEARAWAEEGVAACRQTGDRHSLAVALGNLGRICGIMGEYEQAGQYIRDALEHYRALGSRRGVATSLHNLSTLAYIAGDYAQARLLRLETLVICREIGFSWGIASALKGLGDVARQFGDYKQALRYLDESLAIHRRLGDRWNEANLLNSLAAVARDQGDAAQAEQFYRQALHIAVEIEAGTLIVAVLGGMAGLLTVQGHDEQALEMLAFAQAHPACEQQSRDEMAQIEAAIAARVPAETFQLVRRRGQSKTLDEIIAGLE